MKATGIVRKFDENGRFVIPMELRKQLSMNTQDDAVEVFVEDDMIILRKYEPSCVFCAGMENLVGFKDKKVCKKCAEKINIQIKKEGRSKPSFFNNCKNYSSWNRRRG